MTKDEYIEKKQRQLDVWSAEMDVLEAGAHKLKEVALLKYQDKLIVLHAKRAEGMQRIAAIKAVTDGTWERLKADTDVLWDALKDSVHQFKSHFKAPAKSQVAAKI
jgi:hypothetical protein